MRNKNDQVIAIDEYLRLGWAIDIEDIESDEEGGDYDEAS